MQDNRPECQVLCLDCAEALVDTWLPSIVEIAMVAPHERQKASTDSLLDGGTEAPQAAYLVMILSGVAPPCPLVFCPGLAALVWCCLAQDTSVMGMYRTCVI